MEKLEPLCSVDGNVNWYNTAVENIWQFLKNIKIELR